MAKILVIDNEPSIRDFLDKRLRKDGYEVVLAENGEAGLELFCQESPDIVVLDLQLPGMEGLTALNQVRRLNPTQEVIVLAGAGMSERAQQVRALGVTECIAKESSLHLVGDSVKRLLGRTDSSA